MKMKKSSPTWTLFLEDFDIGTMINDAASTVTTLVEKNNNVLDIQVDKNLGSMHADMTKVRQIVFNLVSNAAKFTSGGKVGIEASAMDKNGNAFIRLAVTDTGIGIPEDKLDHIFEEFSQADNSTTRNYGGTGLGLALVRKFALMMGGDIRVESTPGEGSTFMLELPIRVVEVDEKTEYGKNSGNRRRRYRASIAHPGPRRTGIPGDYSRGRGTGNCPRKVRKTCAHHL